MTETMEIAEILDLVSVDSPDETVEEVMPGKRVDAWYYDELRRIMRESPQSVPPVHVAPASTMMRDYPTVAGRLAWMAEDGDPMLMGNGHHRVKLAIEFGWTEMAVTAVRADTD